MRTRLYNARILTMKDNYDILIGEIWVKDRMIEKIISESSGSYIKESKQQDCNTNVFDQEIDCMGNLIMPGFKNCHAHGPMTFLRSYADDLPLHDWLHDKIFPAEAKLKEADIDVLMKLAILEYVRSGITTSFEMYFYPEQIVKACEDMHFPVIISGTVFGNSSAQVKSAIDTLKNDYGSFHKKNEFVDYRLGFHSEYSCCYELLEAIGDLCVQLKEPVYMHNSETQKEVDECIAKYGLTPIQLMNSLKMFEYGGGGHHLVYTTEDDWDIMKEKGLYAVTNPSSNYKLASGMAPLKSYIDKGIPVAIGTDGPASNNSLNMFKEMYLACCGSKLKYMDAKAVAPKDVLKMATVNGSHLLGLMDADILDEGKWADLIMVDLLKPNMQPLNNIMNNLVYSGSVDNVLMTMIHGDIVYANHQYFMDVDPIDIYKEANCIIRRIECEI
ncbi:MAG: amidohydrolase family protein [Lachnospiraceae bacterium]